MKNICILVFSTILLLSSCSSQYYYCATLQTQDEGTVKDRYGNFLIQSDSIDVTFSFFGENAPIRVGVLNKMSKSLYVDWSKSGIIIDDVIIPYLEPEARAKSNIIDFNYFLDNSTVVSYLKPYTEINEQILELSNFNFQEIDNATYHTWYTQADRLGDNKQYNVITYNEEQSPIYLTTYLAIYEDSMKVNDPYYYELDFYMSELVKIKTSSPEQIASIKNRRGDSFYVKEQKTLKEKQSINIRSTINSVTEQINQWAVEGSTIKDKE